MATAGGYGNCWKPRQVSSNARNMTEEIIFPQRQQTETSDWKLSIFQSGPGLKIVDIS